MKVTCITLFLMSLLVSCSSSRKTATDVNSPNGTEINAESEGSSYENAIVLQAKNESHGVDAEYAWIRQHYPGSVVRGQLLSYKDHKPYDIIGITTTDGKDLSIYFDISGFYGKF
jgi:hypothetical protein